MKKTLLLSFAVLGLAGMAGCSSDTPPATTPMVEAAPPPPPAPMGDTVTYACSHGDGTVMVTYSPDSAQITHNDVTANASRVHVKGKSMVFRGDGVSLRRNGRSIIVGMADKHVLTCRARG